VVETDIASCFEAIPHERLMQAVEERNRRPSPAQAPPRAVACRVMEEGAVRRSVSGTLPRAGRLALARQRLARAPRALVAKRRKKPRSYGLAERAYQSPRRLRLINLDRGVIAPRPNRPRRLKAECPR
jgi:hypothetical protein